MTVLSYVPGSLGLSSLAEDENSRAYLAAAESAASDVPGVTADMSPYAIGRIGVVGAGTMGRGIATSCANAGLSVRLFDVNRAARDAVIPAIRATYARGVARGKISEYEAQTRLSRIEVCDALDALSDRDCVIEAVFESLSLKQEVFRQLDAVCRRGAILATNTSTLDVDAIASVTRRPQDVVGLHFFAPAHVMRMLEIVRGRRTQPAVIAAALQLANRLDKIGVVVGVCFGFVGNRMAYAYGAEASRLLLEGATPAQIDSVLERWGFAMGPFAVGDLSGLDVDWRVRQELTLTDEQRALSLVDDELVARGRLGQKSGAGFYLYPQGPTGPREADPEVDALVMRTAQVLGIARSPRTDDEVLERCLLVLINEGGRLLDEGIALRASDIDLIYAHGFGFPKRVGGPMRVAEVIGPSRIVEALRAYESTLGPRFAPATALVNAARQP